MKNILTKLANHRSTPCVSLIIPSELKSFADKESLMLKLKENVIDAEITLRKKYGQDTADKIGSSMKTLVESVDPKTLAKGIGLYVSADMAEKVDLPFPVVERSLVADQFDLSDIEESIKLLSSYDVIVLSRKESRLFTGSGEKLSPVSDDVFPVIFEDEFQVKRPGQYSFYNNEESKINQARRDSYFRKIDKALSRRNSHTPIVLVGTVENLSDFKNVRKSPQPIVGEVLGNMDHTNINDISKKVWNEISDYITERAMSDYQSTLFQVIGKVL